MTSGPCSFCAAGAAAYAKGTDYRISAGLRLIFK